MNLQASDGLLARKGGAWTREKLEYLRKYAQAFTTAMTPKKRAGRWSDLVYVDLLCGPGINIDDRGEFSGSPLIAINTRPFFDRIFLSDASHSTVGALKRRIPVEKQDRVSCEVGKCQDIAASTVHKISRDALVLAFVDPQGFEVPFSVLRELASRRVDVIYLFPTGIGIKRNLRQFASQRDSVMDLMWGGREWRNASLTKVALGELRDVDPADLNKDWSARFYGKVATIGFSIHDPEPPLLTNDQNGKMYQLLFFSRGEAALKLWKGIKKIEPSGQRKLL